MNILTQEYVFACLEQERNGVQFPIKFEEAWRGAGYSRKDNAKKAIANELIEGEDYTIDNAWDLLHDDLTIFTDSAFRRELSTIGITSENGLNFSPQEKASLMRLEIIKLSPDGFDHFCMMARTKQGREARKQFIQYKKAYLAQLERSLFATPDPELERLRQRVAELEAKLEASETHAAFPYTLEELHEISGIVNKSHVKGAVLLSFEPDIDYMERNGKLFLSTDTFSILITSLRSKRGTDISRLPAIIRLQTIKYFQYVQPKRKNTRLGQRECPGQLTLL